MQIREYDTRYQEQVIQFLDKCLPESGRQLDLNGRHKMYRRIESAFEGFWCLFDGETVIGTAALKRLNDECCELKSLYLLEAYHGRQLGRRLLSVALEEAEKRGFRKIYLDSLSSSKKAIALYEKNGFMKTERYNDNPAADVFMVLELGNQSEAGQKNRIRKRKRILWAALLLLLAAAVLFQIGEMTRESLT